jgi:hypothetical protein
MKDLYFPCLTYRLLFSQSLVWAIASFYSRGRVFLLLRPRVDFRLWLCRYCRRIQLAYQVSTYIVTLKVFLSDHSVIKTFHCHGVLLEDWEKNPSVCFLWLLSSLVQILPIAQCEAAMGKWHDFCSISLHHASDSRSWWPSCSSALLEIACGVFF